MQTQAAIPIKMWGWYVKHYPAMHQSQDTFWLWVDTSQDSNN